MLFTILATQPYIADEAVNQLNSETRALSPFKRMETQTVSISIEDTLRLSPDTWQIDWSEQIWSKKGDMLGKEHWRGTFKVEMKIPDSKENNENESDSNTPGGQLGHPGKTLDFFENPD